MASLRTAGGKAAVSDPPPYPRAAHIIVSAQSPNLLVSVLGRDRVAAFRAGDRVIPGCAPDAAHKVIHVSLPSVVLPWFIPRGCGGYQLCELPLSLALAR